MPQDPVCKMEVDLDNAAGHTEYDGNDYYFCSTTCQQKFEASPTSYVNQEAA